MEANTENAGKLPVSGKGSQRATVSLYESELAALDSLAAKLGVKRNWAMRWLLRQALILQAEGQLPEAPRALPTP